MNAQILDAKLLSLSKCVLRQNSQPIAPEKMQPQFLSKLVKFRNFLDHRPASVILAVNRRQRPKQGATKLMIKKFIVDVARQNFGSVHTNVQPRFR